MLQVMQQSFSQTLHNIRMQIYCQRRLRSHVPFFTSFLSAAPLISLMYFNVMCEQHHRNSFNPFLNIKIKIKGVKTLHLNQPFSLDVPLENRLITRMHSSRMRTVRSSGHLSGGVCSGGCLLPGGVSAPRGGVCSWGVVCSGGCLLLWGVCLGGVCSWGVSALGGVCSQGGACSGGGSALGEGLLWGVSALGRVCVSHHALR